MTKEQSGGGYIFKPYVIDEDGTKISTEWLMPYYNPSGGTIHDQIVADPSSPDAGKPFAYLAKASLPLWYLDRLGAGWTWIRDAVPGASEDDLELVPGSGVVINKSEAYKLFPTNLYRKIGDEWPTVGPGSIHGAGVPGAMQGARLWHVFLKTTPNFGKGGFRLGEFIGQDAGSYDAHTVTTASGGSRTEGQFFCSGLAGGDPNAAARGTEAFWTTGEFWKCGMGSFPSGSSASAPVFNRPAALICFYLEMNGLPGVRPTYSCGNTEITLSGNCATIASGGEGGTCPYPGGSPFGHGTLRIQYIKFIEPGICNDNYVTSGSCDVTDKDTWPSCPCCPQPTS